MSVSSSFNLDTAKNESQYSRMDQVKVVEDSQNLKGYGLLKAYKLSTYEG